MIADEALGEAKRRKIWVLKTTKGLTLIQKIVSR
jgi:hypothetical protein